MGWIMDELLSEFIAETLETLEALSSEVVAWEADPTDKGRLDAFFRFFHTVKGSCGFLNLPRFERLSHAAEDVLAAIRSGERVADPATISAVLAIMDRIGLLANVLCEGGEGLSEEEDDNLLLALAAEADAVEIFARAPVTVAIANIVISTEGPEETDEIVTPEPEAQVAAQPQQTASTPESPGPGRDSHGRDKGPRTIRLPLSLIDQLMNGVSDMVLARNELARKMRERGVDPDLDSSFERLSANVADMRDMISKTRMQRVDRLYAAIPRMVRDLSRELGKKVSVEMDGGDVEMDREMIEMVVDPLTHIVRNALDHGIESPSVRLAAGKPETGSLRLVARQSGNQIVIEISDDGKGIDRAALVEKAVAKGLFTSSAAAALDQQARLNLIFNPGLSTAKAVTSISGRGVGMDVVRTNVEQIGGVIGIESRPGRGTTITMRVPLTLTIIPGLIVRCGERYFAIPRGNVVELLHQDSMMIETEEVGGASIVSIRGERHALIDLEDVLGIEKCETIRGPRTLLIVRSSGGIPYALGVEAVESNEELVIRPASPLIAMAGIYAGMTLPDNGQPMLLLDAAGIAQAARLPLREIAATPAGRSASVAEEKAHSISALHFIELDGARRLLPLGVIDRVEDIPTASIGQAGGRRLVTIDDELVPVLNWKSVKAETVKALRLRAGEQLLCYLIDEVVDIIDVPMPEKGAKAAAGDMDIVLSGGQPFELIDPFMLFARSSQDEGAPQRAGKRCVIAADGDGWMSDILAPLLRQAGHEVRFDLAAEWEADIVLLPEGQDAPTPTANLPVLRIRGYERADPAGSPSVYRYDRAGILGAIERAGLERAA